VEILLEIIGDVSVKRLAAGEYVLLPLSECYEGTMLCIVDLCELDEQTGTVGDDGWELGGICPFGPFGRRPDGMGGWMCTQRKRYVKL